MTMPLRRFEVTVVALAGGVGWVCNVMVPVGQTIGWAVQASSLWVRHPQLQGARLGVFGKLRSPDTVAQPGDRIEVYSPCDSAAMAAARKRAPRNSLSPTKLAPTVELAHKPTELK